MHRQIILDGSHSDFGRQTIGEAELARGDAAEGDAFEVVFIGASHDVAVARGQLFLLEFRRDSVGNDRSNRMDDVFARQVVGLGNLGMARWFFMALTEHQLMAFFAQLYARGGMDGVVDATVQRVETPQHLAVGGVDDGVDAQAGDVALP